MRGVKGGGRRARCELGAGRVRTFVVVPQLCEISSAAARVRYEQGEMSAKRGLWSAYWKYLIEECNGSVKAEGRWLATCKDRKMRDE